MTRPNHHLGRRVFSAELAVPGNRAESVALSFPVINETFQGSLTLVARATSQCQGLAPIIGRFGSYLTA